MFTQNVNMAFMQMKTSKMAQRKTRRSGLFAQLLSDGQQPFDCYLVPAALAGDGGICSGSSGGDSETRWMDASGTQ